MKHLKASSNTRLTALILILLVGAVGFSAVMIRRASAARRPAPLVPTIKTVCSAGGADFTTIGGATGAVNDANTNFPTGNVTYNVCPGHTETLTATISLTATGSVGNDIIFQKNGAGANPLITSYIGGVGTPGTAVQDGLWRLVGSDFVTIDGIDLVENAANVANPATMEYGYALYKASATDGAQNNTIKNCVITLNRINNATGTAPAVDGSRGIDVMNAIPTAANAVVTVTAASGTNSNNKFYTNTIQNVNIGIAMIGFAAASPFTLADTNNDIGGAAAGTGNQILNYGGGAATNPAAGIRTLAQYNENISFNTINNNNGAGVNHATTLRGIFNNTAVSASATISNNTITVKSGATTSNLTAIENVAGATAAGNTISINSNTITGCTYTTATSGAFTGITTTASAATVNINSNILSSNATNATSGTTNLIQNTGAATVALNINNNNINGWTFNAATSGTLNGINSTGTVTAAVSISTNNFQAITHAVAGTNAHNYITYSNATSNTANINSNTFTNLSVNTTGSVNFIIRTGAMTATGVENVNSNSIVTAFSKGASGGTVTFFNANSTSVNGSTMINNLNNFSNVTVPGSTVVAGWANTEGASATSGPTKTITNNTVNNITAITTPTGSITGMSVNFSGPNTVVSGNTLSNYTGGAAITGLALGSSNQSLTATQNIVDPITSSGASIVTGISVTSSTSVTVTRNKIYDLSGTNAGSIVNGILVTGGVTVTVANNLIGNLTAPAASGTDVIRGISSTSTTATSNIFLYFNTIFINASSSGANFGTSGVFHTASATATTAALTMKNNIIDNNSTAAGTGLVVAYRRSTGTAGTLANYTTASNNNDFYAGTPSATNLIYSDGTSSAQTITAYRNGVFTAGTIAPRDSVSISENPPFLSTTGSSAQFLHINPATPTQLESGGSPVAGITDDFDGQTRNVSTPDIGADEGAFTLLDLTAPSITYTPFSNTSLTANRTLTVTITDASGVPTSGTLQPRIYYRKNGGPYFSNQCSLASGSGTNGTWSCTINYADVGGVTLGDVIDYYVVAQDTLGNIGANPSAGFAATDVNNVGTPPTTPNTYTIIAAFAASVNVGTGQTFTSLSNNDAAGLFKAMNAGIFTGNTVVNITSDLTNESGAIGLVQLAEEGVGAGTFTVLIKSSGGPRLITGTAAAASVINLLGADRVTIDGDDPSTGAVDRAITISSINTASGTGPIFIGSPGIGAGNVNDTIKNCIIQANSIGTTATFTFGIFVGNASGAAAGADNDNLTISNNQIRRARTGIQAVGDPIGLDDNLQIIDNLIGDPVQANSIGRIAVIASTANNATVSRNTIQNITIASDTASPAGINVAGLTGASVIGQNTITGIAASGSSLVPAGIVAGTSTGVSITQNVIDGVTSSSSVGPEGIVVVAGFANSSITRNDIKNITYTGTGGYGGKGIDVQTNNAASNITIANNFVSNIKGDCWQPGANILDTIMAIRVIGTSGGVKIYHNSVNLASGAFAGNSISGSISAALYVAAGATALDVRDNAFFNNLDNTTITNDKNYTLYSDAPATAFTDSNYNDYFVPVSSATGPQTLGFIGAADRLLLSDIQTGTTKDANSKNVDPLFSTATDLHLQAGSPLLGQGFLIPGIDNDFDNDLRDSPPDIGADEIVTGSRTGPIPAGTYRDANLGNSSLGGNVTVQGNLTLSGVVTTSANTLVVDCGGTVTGASNTNYVDGNVQKNFCAPGSFSYPVGDPASGPFAPPPTTGYMPVDVTVTTLTTNPSSLTVNANNGLAPSTPPLNPAVTLSAFWTITEAGDLTANLSFNYQQGDVNGTEANYRAIQVEGTTPINYPNTVLDTTNNIASVSGITNFSDWTLGQPFAPTASPANISGHVLTNSGQPLSGVTLTLFDTILVENRTTVTDANGAYNFNAILTGREIRVTPSRQGYNFSPQNRLFSHTGNIANIDFTAAPDSTTLHPTTNDFDGDGRTDLAVFRPSNGYWFITLSTTGAILAEHWGLDGDRIVPADYDGDHKTDMAVFRPSNGTWYINRSSNGTMQAMQWGLSDDIVQPGDYDGDGRADIAVFRPSNGTWYIFESGSGQLRAVNWGLAGDYPVAADYDGDNKADVAVFRPSTGTWYIIKSTDGENRFEQWGLSTDHPVVGDYDADGKADVAVFRASNTTWYILNSGDGSIDAKSHGTSADRLVPGDFDGDGKTDRAVWQPTSGDWVILKSTTNSSSTQHWGTNGDVPAPNAYVP